MIEAFRIGVMLNMTSNASGVLNILGREFLGLNTHITNTMMNLNRVKIAVAGLGAMTFGAVLLKATADFYEAGQDLVHQQAILQQALGGTADAHMRVAEATKAAWAATRDVRGTTVTGNLEAIADLRNVFGSLSEAVQLMPAFQRMAQELSDVGGKVGEAGGGSAFLAARAVEIRGGLIGADGQVDPVRLLQQLDMMTKVMVATRGRVDPQQYVNFVQRARSAGMTLSDDALFGTLPALMLAMGGNVAGTGLQQAWKAAVTGRMTKQGAHVADSLGLLAAGVTSETGEVSSTKGLIGGALFAADPVKWVQSILMPALSAHGIKSDVDIAKTISSIFTDRTAAGFVTELWRNMASIMKEQTNIREASGDQSNLEDTDSKQKMRDFHSAWSNLMTAIGSPFVTEGMRVLTMATSALNSVTAVLAAHPQAVRIILDVMAGLGAFLVVAGGIAIAGSALAFIAGGGVAAALGGVIAGVAALALVLKEAQWQALWDAFLAPIHKIRDFLIGPKPDAAQFINPWAAGGAAAKQSTPWLFPPPSALPPEPMKRGNDNMFHPSAYRPDDGSDTSIHIYLDGRELTDAIVKRIVRGAQGPIAGNPTNDGRRLYGLGNA